VITFLELDLGFDFDVFIGRDILPSEKLFNKYMDNMTRIAYI